jgi:hypothetical protein
MRRRRNEAGSGERVEEEERRGEIHRTARREREMRKHGDRRTTE